MRRDDPILAPVDVGLLDLLSREPSLVAACARLGIRRDRGVYRLRRLGRIAGRPVVESERGGRAKGSTRLTPLGRRLLARGVGAPIGPRAGRSLPVNRWTGRWHGSPGPRVDVAPGLSWSVDFLAREGETVTVTLEPEAVLVATARFPTSARNTLPARVTRVRSIGPGTGARRRLLEARVGRAEVRAAITAESVERLGISPGRPVVLYVKATSLRRGDRGARRAVPGTTRGSPRS